MERYACHANASVAIWHLVNACDEVGGIGQHAFGAGADPAQLSGVVACRHEQVQKRLHTQGKRRQRGGVTGVGWRLRRGQ